MNEPKVSMLVALSAFSSGVPVKPMNIAPGNSAFMALCILPDCVRCASSTKTNRLPLGANPDGTRERSSAMKSSLSRSRSLSSSLPRNLWTRDAISQGSCLLS